MKKVEPMTHFGRHMLEHWALNRSTTYLNHGTVGAPPRRVLAAQQRLRDEIEEQPSRFLLRELTEAPIGASKTGQPRLRAAADEVARFLGARGNDLVFVDNATSGINAVLRAFDFRDGDELLLMSHTYGAIRKSADYATRVRGATVRSAEIPEAITTATVVKAMQEAVGPRTRLAIIDHVTSDSALILPVAEIASECHNRNVAVLVDGAHAPGAIPVDIPSLGVDWYTGNLHKWAWSPRSSAILWTDPAHQAVLHHTVISWGLDQGITHEFDWPGTRDPTPHLTAPEGIAFMRELGIDNVRRYNHGLAWDGGRKMAARWKTELLGPEEMIGTMVTVPLPVKLGTSAEDAIRLRDALLFEDQIEVHVYAWKGRIRARISAQIYNEMSDIDRFIEAIDRHL